MRILLTGSNGQLGQDLVDILRGEEVLPFDHATLDVTDRKAVDDVVGRMRPDWIINCAAYNDVDGAEDHARLAMAVNADGPGNLAGAGRRHDARLLHISTDYVFDGKKGSAYVETDEPRPVNAYGRSKLEGERRVLETMPTAAIFRTAWLYGRAGSNFVKTVLALAARGAPLRMVSDQVGSPTSTADLAVAIREFVAHPVAGIFHVANAGGASRYEQAKAIVQGRVEVIPITTAEAGRRADRPAYSVLASVRWQAAAFRPLRPWRDALADFLSGS